MQSRSRAPDLSYSGWVAFAKCERLCIHGLMYSRQLIRIDIEALSILVIAAETSWIKSRVNCGANSASFSLRFKTNVVGPPEMNPASEDVKKDNITRSAGRTFTCDEGTLVVLEVAANCPKEVIRGALKFFFTEINTK